MTTQFLPMQCTAFSGSKRIGSGDLLKVAAKAKAAWDREQWSAILIFDDVTSEVIDVDYSGSAEEVLARVAQRFPGVSASVKDEVAEHEVSDDVARRPGRPRLGVVAREVTLLPRHWDWLASQPGGASVALRKLVEQARLANHGKDQRRRAQESAYRFLSAMAGNEEGFEEATRALFANNQKRFEVVVKSWPRDVRVHAVKLAATAFAAG